VDFVYHMTQINVPKNNKLFCYSEKS